MAKQSLLKIILFLLFLIDCSLCPAQNRKGTYTIQRQKNAFPSKCIIRGSVVEFATKQPFEVAFIQIDTLLIKTDTLVHFHHELFSEKHQVRAGYIGYYFVDLCKINVRRGELITILFRLKQDTTPLVD